MEWISELDIYLLVTSTLIGLGAGVHSYVTSRAMAHRRIIDAVTERVEATESKIKIVQADNLRLKEKIESMDLHDDIETLHGRVTDMSRTVSEQTGQMKQMNQTLHLIQDYLLKK